MANAYSFEKLIQLLSQNFDVKIIDYNEKKYITVGCLLSKFIALYR